MNTEKTTLQLLAHLKEMTLSDIDWTLECMDDAGLLSEKGKEVYKCFCDNVMRDVNYGPIDTSSWEEFVYEYEKAKEIMGENQFIGAEDIEETFGFKPQIVPDIPFSTSELERAKELGQQLILYVDTKADGTPFTMEDMIPSDPGEITLSKYLEKPGLGGKGTIKPKFSFFSDNRTSDGKVFLYNKDQDGNWLYTDTEAKLRSETPRLGWRLTTSEIIEGSTNKNYLEQIETLIEYLKKEHFKGVDMPKVYQEAIDEFNNKKYDIFSALMYSDCQAAAKILSELSISQLTGERLSEIIYRSAINEKKLGVKNLASKYSLSISLSAFGKLVGVGHLYSNGLNVLKLPPWASSGGIGVCFSAAAHK